MSNNEKKTFVLDTNILLSDAMSLTSFKDNDVVLPLIVLEELDRHKDRQDDTGREAREVSRKLNALLQETTSLKSGLKLSSGGRLFILSIEEAETLSHEEKAPEDIGETSTRSLPSELNGKAGDNIILTFCLALQKSRPELVLVTRDVLLSVKAKSLGIPCETYKKMQVTASADTLYSGSEKTIEAEIDFKKAYDGNLEFQDLSPYIECLPNPNEFFHVTSPTSNQSVLLRFVGFNKPFKCVQQEKVDNLQTRNREQKYALDLLVDPNVKLVTLVGKAGSGKTLLAIAAGLEQTIGGRGKIYKSLVVSKPVTPMGGKGNDIGFLPGTLEEKMEPWVAPIKDNLRFLMSHGKKTKQSEDTLALMFERGIIEVEALMYIRGRSIADAFMIIDEAQNLTAHELKTIITRVGEGTKIVLTGDIEQIDNLGVDSTSNGLAIAVEKFKNSPLTGHVTLYKGERSELATLAAELL